MALRDVVAMSVPALRELATALEEELAEVPPPDDVGIPLATEVRLPMLNLDQAWYEATRRYGPYNYHPLRAEDFNLESGGDTDLGEPLVAPFSGLVLSAHDWGGGVGQVVQVLGVVPGEGMVVWSGWHLETMAVATGELVRVGREIGTIGNAEGRYAAHLHNQVCVINERGIPGPWVFADGRYDWRQPSAWYAAHGVDVELVQQVTEYDGRPLAGYAAHGVDEELQWLAWYDRRSGNGG